LGRAPAAMNKKILLVEDDVETLEMLRGIFAPLDYHLLSASFGAEAVSVATAEHPDLILLDIQLPDFDGYEVCRRLRAQQRTAYTPIIFLTVKRERDSKLAGLQLGAVDYITKPFDIAELIARVEVALRRSDLRPLDHPVTSLPGEDLLREQLGRLSQQSDWSLTRLDVEGLDGFDAAYGFVARDDMLRAIGLTLKDIVEGQMTPAGFLAHLDTSVFYIIAAPAGDVAQRLAEPLYRTVAAFYPAKDREASLAGRAHAPAVLIYANTVSAGGLDAPARADILQLVSQTRQLLTRIP
jgi:DNA-binding response OmpR family regulator